MTSERSILFVIIALGIVGTASIAGGAWLAINGKEYGGFITIAGTAIGGLAAMLSSTHSTPQDSRSVTTTTATIETPAPVEEPKP